MSIYQDIIRADAIVAAVHWCQTNKVAIDCTDGLWQITTWQNGFEYRSDCKFDFVEAVEELRGKCDPTSPLFKGHKPEPLRTQ